MSASPLRLSSLGSAPLRSLLCENPTEFVQFSPPRAVNIARPRAQCSVNSAPLVLIIARTPGWGFPLVSLKSISLSRTCSTATKRLVQRVSERTPRTTHSSSHLSFAMRSFCSSTRTSRVMMGRGQCYLSRSAAAIHRPLLLTTFAALLLLWLQPSNAFVVPHRTSISLRGDQPAAESVDASADLYFNRHYRSQVQRLGREYCPSPSACLAIIHLLYIYISHRRSYIRVYTYAISARR